MNEKEIIRAFNEKFGSIEQHGYRDVPINAEVSAFISKSLSDQREEIEKEQTEAVRTAYEWGKRDVRKEISEAVRKEGDYELRVEKILSIINPSKE